MIVVADTSPLIVLCRIGQVHALPALFGQVLIPPEVKNELASTVHIDEAYRLATSPPFWLVERRPAQVMELPDKLDPGERAAITLALEVHADFLLMDELAGRKEALLHGLRIAGAVGVLEMAADANLLTLADAFERLKLSGLWISHEFLDKRLQAFHNRGKMP